MRWPPTCVTRTTPAARPVCPGAFRFVADDLGDGNGFAGQQRLVGLQVVALEQNRVGGNPVALDQHQEIAAHHFAPRYASP